MKIIKTPVLIIGGAGCGLSLTILLARQGIESWLVERYPNTSPAPKAHYLNQRTMEIFREEGIADAIYQVSTPAENMASVGWYTSVGGEGDLDAKLIAKMDAFGGGALRETYERNSPVRAANYAQLHLEPLLLAHARTLPLARLNYHHVLQSFHQTADGVIAIIQDRGSESTYEVHAQYMIGADGGRTVGPALGIAMHGVERLFDMVTCHFAADMSAALKDDEPMIRWFINPEKGGSWGSGVMVAMGPKHFDRHSEEWLLHFAFQPDDPAQFDKDSVVPRLKELLRLPELAPQVMHMNNWKVQGVLAETYRVDRVFLAGDAAHRHPPTTGLGLNSAIQDSHNLAWKLAAVLRGEAAPSLLDTYEAERRPVAARNVAWALLTFQNHLVIDAGIGQIPGAPVEVNREAFRALFAPGDDGDTRRQRLREVVHTQRIEFQAQDMEIGYFYNNSAAVVPDGTPAPERDAMGGRYAAIARPGHRLPHAWVKKDGQTLSTLDLVGRGRFTLITGPGQTSLAVSAETHAKAYGIALACAAIGPGATYEDDTGRWAEISGIAGGGALLVRPDGHVAWRHAGSGAAAQEGLEAAFGRILGRQTALAAAE